MDTGNCGGRCRFLKRGARVANSSRKLSRSSVEVLLGAVRTPLTITSRRRGSEFTGPDSSCRPMMSPDSQPSSSRRRNICFVPGRDILPSLSFITGRPSKQTILYTMSDQGASADTPALVPTPNRSMGAPSCTSESSSYSSSPPLTSTLT